MFATLFLNKTKISSNLKSTELGEQRVFLFLSAHLL